MRLGTIVSIGASAVLGIGALLIARLWIPSHAPHPAAAQAAATVVEAPVVDEEVGTHHVEEVGADVERPRRQR